MWTFAFGDGSLFLFSWSFTPCWYWLEAESWLQAELWTRRSFLFWWIHVSFYTWIWYLITKWMHYRKTSVAVHFELIFHSDFSWKGVLPLEVFCNPDFSVMCRAMPGGWLNARNLSLPGLWWHFHCLREVCRFPTENRGLTWMPGEFQVARCLYYKPRTS